jgi:phosphate transport system protein
LSDSICKWYSFRGPAQKKELLEFANHTEHMLDKAMQGLLKRDRSLLDEVLGADETRANESELHIDELCVSLIAQYAPKGRDLRAILMILRMNNDLERMADHAVNIAQSAVRLIEQPPVKPLIDIPHLAEVAGKMLHDSITSFVDENALLAKSVCDRDDVVDNLKMQLMRELITYMTSDATTISRSLDLIRIANNLERVGDLSTNICEDVIFMAEGRVIKHHADESAA